MVMIRKALPTKNAAAADSPVIYTLQGGVLPFVFRMQDNTPASDLLAPSHGRVNMFLSFVLKVNTTRSMDYLSGLLPDVNLFNI